MANKWIGRMPAAEYHADPCEVPSLSSHVADTLVNDCPARARHEHPRLGGARREPATAEQDEGTLIHAVLLGTIGPGQFVGIEANDWRTKAAQEARDAAKADGKIPLLMRRFEQLMAAAGNIRDALLGRGIDFGAQMTEHAAIWDAIATDGRPVQCRSMLDAFDPMTGIVTDLKTIERAHPKTIRRQIENYGYAIQATCYRRAVETLMPDFVGRTRFRWVFVETRKPYIVTIARPSASMETLGRVQWEQAVDTWQACLESDRWPEYAEDELVIEASPWALADVEASNAFVQD